ncbi:MAG: hypothetical protein R3E99_12705 [Burkholderiaceae bacterium]
MKQLAALSVLLALTACATADKPYWAKPNVSSDDTYTELSECRYQVGLAKVDKDDRELMVAHFMRGKGFRLLANQAE